MEVLERRGGEPIQFLREDVVRLLGLDSRFRWIVWNGWVVPVNEAYGIAPYFTREVLARIRKKLAVNIIVTGEAGIGKSVLAINIARVIYPRLKVRNIVFTYKQFMDLISSGQLHIGEPIVFDEPSYALSHREWYKELNRVLVRTMESIRFKVHPIFIPVINQSLLDKTIRQYLIQYQILVHDRGHATVYRLYPSHTQDNKIYRYRVSTLYFDLFELIKCRRYRRIEDTLLNGKHSIEEVTCIGCPWLWKQENGKYVCNHFRAQYERKKAAIQETRYKTASILAEEIEKRKLSTDQIVDLILDNIQNFVDENGKPQPHLIMQEYKIGRGRAYMIARIIKDRIKRDPEIQQKLKQKSSLPAHTI